MGQPGVVLKASLRKSQLLYQGLSKHIEDYVAQAQGAGVRGAADAKEATQAMTALLLNNQIQQNMQQLNAIEQKLTVDIPQELADAQAALASNLNQQKEQQQAITRANLDLENFDVQQARKVQGLQASITQLQSQRQALMPSRIVGQPTRSPEPVGVGRAVIVVLAGILGLFLGLLIALFSGYLQVVRQRMQTEQTA